MQYHLKSFFIFFLIIAILFFIGTYFYFNDTIFLTNLFNKNTNITWEEASIKTTTNWGLCPPLFPCYETYTLISTIGLNAKILHNDELSGEIFEKEGKKLIKTVYNLYLNKICTPFYATDVFENYELKIDEKAYKFGDNKGCKEMQTIINTFKEPVGI